MPDFWEFCTYRDINKTHFGLCINRAYHWCWRLYFMSDSWFFCPQTEKIVFWPLTKRNVWETRCSKNLSVWRQASDMVYRPEENIHLLCVVSTVTTISPWLLCLIATVRTISPWLLSHSNSTVSFWDDDVVTTITAWYWLACYAFAAFSIQFFFLISWKWK